MTGMTKVTKVARKSAMSHGGSADNQAPATKPAKASQETPSAHNAPSLASRKSASNHGFNYGSNHGSNHGSTHEHTGTTSPPPAKRKREDKWGDESGTVSPATTPSRSVSSPVDFIASPTAGLKGLSSARDAMRSPTYATGTLPPPLYCCACAKMLHRTPRAPLWLV